MKLFAKLKKALIALVLPLALVACSDTLLSQQDLTPAAPAALVSIDPIVGLPAEQSAPLIQSLIARGAAQGITMAQQDASARYIYKGYLSSVPGAEGNSIVHVWDLFDATGNRVHRVNGMVPVPAEGAGLALEQVATEAADRLAAFLRTQGQ